jgi:antitoxin component YwqK of YwqJK toxin-antitoxin module
METIFIEDPLHGNVEKLKNCRIIKLWYPNGNKRQETTHKNGFCHGIYQHWNEDGTRSFIDINKFQMEHGIRIFIQYERG